MSEYIGLRSHLLDEWALAFGQFSHLKNSATLKQQALLFDRIGIKDWSPSKRNSDVVDGTAVSGFTQWLDELSWLQDKKVVFDAYQYMEEITGNTISQTPKISQQLNFSHQLLKKGAKTTKELLDNVFTTIMGKKTKREKDKKESLSESMQDRFFEKFIQIESYTLRSLAIAANLSSTTRVIPLVSYSDRDSEISTPIKSDVVEIVVNKLPMPSIDVPWETILDYRDDPETQKSLRALRKWVRKFSLENISPIEISDELETLIDEYQNHMKLHKVKANTETLEVILKIPFEILENLIKIKFSKIPEPFFAVKRRQISLMEAEINAPARDIAYILKTNEKFPNS